MRNKEYVGALRPEGDFLVLIALRHAYEVIPVSELPAPSGRALTKREIDMAKQLVRVMEADFDIDAYHDEYRDRLMELIEAKAKGKVIRFPEAPYGIARRHAPRAPLFHGARTQAAGRRRHGARL